MKKRSVNIAGHATSVSLEEEFWTELKSIAAQDDKSLNQIISEIDARYPRANLSSKIRIYVLERIKTDKFQN